MSLKSLYQKEKYVIINGQSRNFRIKKYIVILIISLLVYLWKGWMAVIYLLLSTAVAGIIIHFIFRWKTSGWTKSWWLYKKIV